MDWLKYKEMEQMNVFHSDVLLPLIRILKTYEINKSVLSPDEFCILLFASTSSTNNFKFDYETFGCNLEDLRNLEVPPSPVQNVIVDLFMNITRFETILKTLSEDFSVKRHYRRRPDFQEIIVLIYVIVYRIFAISFSDSTDCFHQFGMNKVHSLVSYLLQTDTITLVHKTGCLNFDEDFVEQRLVLPFLDAVSRLKEFDNFLRQEKKILRGIGRHVTIPLLMNVLKRPKKLPKAPPPSPAVPTWGRILSCTTSPVRFRGQCTYAKPSIDEKLASIYAANKMKAQNLLNESNKNAPSCWNRKPKDLVKDETEKETKRVVKPPPSFKTVEIKPTTASILRECARIISDETKGAEKFKVLAEGGRDPSLILKLEEQTRQQQRDEDIKKMQERYLSALLIREGAFIAKESLLNNTKLRAANVRNERRKLYDRLERWRKNHAKEVVAIVERCRQMKQASRDAQNYMIHKKRQKGAEISLESKQLKTLLAKQREEDTQRKIQLIQEIRTIQSLRPSTVKDFDPTESSGLGLLGEMSLVELRERLFWMKLRMTEDVEHRRSKIRAGREKQKTFVRETQKALEKYKMKKERYRQTTFQQKVGQCSSIASPEIELLRKKWREKGTSRLEK